MSASAAPMLARFVAFACRDDQMLLGPRRCRLQKLCAPGGENVAVDNSKKAMETAGA
jgi:hypothetical protein